jgi:hypothetical protein
MDSIHWQEVLFGGAQILWSLWSSWRSFSPGLKPSGFGFVEGAVKAEPLQANYNPGERRKAALHQRLLETFCVWVVHA